MVHKCLLLCCQGWLAIRQAISFECCMMMLLFAAGKGVGLMRHTAEVLGSQSTITAGAGAAAAAAAAPHLPSTCSAMLTTCLPRMEG
jgi:hypothetical protein